MAVSTPPPPPASRTWPLALIVGSSIVFSTGGLFVRSMHDDHAWTMVFWRSVSASVSIALFLAWRERGRAIESMRVVGWPGVVVATCFAISSIGMVAALARTSVAVVLVILALTPLATALLARAFLGEPVRPVTWVATCATVTGVAYMVSGPGTTATVAGVLIALVIPVAFAAGTVVIRRHSQVAMVPAMLLACVIGAAVSVPFANPLAVDRHDFVLLLVFGGGQLGVGLALFALGAAGVRATEAALLAMLEPVLGPIWVWIFNDEYPGVAGLIGGGIVFVTLAIHTVVTTGRGPVTTLVEPV
jgi:drug/metabolite transporter (DMT)-like permease